MTTATNSHFEKWTVKKGKAREQDWKKDIEKDIKCSGLAYNLTPSAQRGLPKTTFILGSQNFFTGERTWVNFYLYSF